MNMAQIKQALADMEPRQRLYELVKDEMKRRGRWKNKPRGRAFRDGQKH